MVKILKLLKFLKFNNRFYGHVRCDGVPHFNLNELRFCNIPKYLLIWIERFLYINYYEKG